MSLRDDVERLAFERNERHPDAYARAADLIEQSLAEAGCATSRYGGNVIGELSGTPEIVVVGAHYDSVQGSPGADDNASGVAALLALARTATPRRTLRFVAFANEEPPYFMSAAMGSWQYARHCRKRNENIAAMLCLESLAYFSDAPNSQEYPPMLDGLFPDVANFIAFASNAASAPLLRRVMDAFRAPVPFEGGAFPEEIPGVAWSDQWSFWQFGYAAVMVTDTAPFRNPHYHTAHDTPETLDYERFGRVVEGLQFVVDDLASS